MKVKLDEISCFLHLLLKSRILDYTIVTKHKYHLMVDLLEVEPHNIEQEFYEGPGGNAWFKFLKGYLWNTLKLQGLVTMPMKVLRNSCTSSTRLGYISLTRLTQPFSQKKASYSHLMYLEHFMDLYMITGYTRDTVTLPYLYRESWMLWPSLRWYN